MPYKNAIERFRKSVLKNGHKATEVEKPRLGRYNFHVIPKSSLSAEELRAKAEEHFKKLSGSFNLDISPKVFKGVLDKKVAKTLGKTIEENEVNGFTVQLAISSEKRPKFKTGKSSKRGF
ncbi:MAG: hypothetical protein ACE5DI_05460 [Candidatus Micrarchaeia archaeon]